MTTVPVVLLVVVLSATMPAAAGLVRTWRTPWATVVALCTVGIPTLVQLIIDPPLLSAWERNWALIARGQAWRLITSLVVQDGGPLGALFNLLALLIVGSIAEQVWRRSAWIVITLSAGIGAQFWGAVVQPKGGGDSVAVFGLSAATAVMAALRGTTPSRIVGTIGLAGSLALLVMGDVHGGGGAIGALVAVPLLHGHGALVTVRQLRRRQGRV